MISRVVQATIMLLGLSVSGAAAQSFPVFFDWDRADLGLRARQVIAQAANASGRVSRIEVDAHTDTSGSVGYNQALSVRRAQAVVAELIRDGVPQNLIGIRAHGESYPALPTGDNVREPRNRWVDIVIVRPAQMAYPVYPAYGYSYPYYGYRGVFVGGWSGFPYRWGWHGGWGWNHGWRGGH